jgi:WD40 repeat protein
MSKLYSISNPIHKQTIENQGCSMNLDGLQPVTGYMVGTKGNEQKINILDFNAGHIDSFIRRNLDKLHNRNYFVGTWINDDTVYIDISLNMPHKEQALLWGKANGQICIWDVEKKVEIYQLEEV